MSLGREKWLAHSWRSLTFSQAVNWQFSSLLLEAFAVIYGHKIWKKEEAEKTMARAGVFTKEFS